MKIAMRISFAVIATLFVAGLLSAQAPAAPGEEPKVDTIPVSKLSFKTTKINDSLYILTGIAPTPVGYNVPNGRFGGQIAVLIGPDGIFMVDAQYPPKEISEKVLASIRQFSNAPIRYVVLTHFHGDHTGGNDFFAKMGATIMSSPMLRKRLAEQKGYPVGGVPTVTYDKPMTIYMNGEVIDLYPMYPSHTDGDTIVRFRNADVIMMGDIARAGYPNGVKMASGSDNGGLIDAYGMAIGLGSPATKYIPGHGPFFTRADMIEYRDMLAATRKRIETLKRQEKTADEVLAAHPTADYDDKVLRSGYGYGDVASFYDDGTMPRLKNSDIYVKETYDEVK